MWRFSRYMKLCARIMLIVILWNFLIPSRVCAEPLTEQLQILPENETRLYSDSEVDWLIDEISAAAYEAIERAAAEAAFIREVTLHQADAQFWRLQAETNLLAITVAKKTGIKNAVIAGAVCLIGGLIFGVGGTLIIGR